MKNVRTAAIRLTVVGIVIALMGAMIWTALQTPVKGATRSFAAHIADVSGLKQGSDVRMAGVQVGKITTIALDGTVAYVEFTVAEGQEVYDNTEASVLFSSLIGDRYLALQQKVAPGRKLAAGSTIPIERTHGAFDISELFDAVRPIFETLSSGSVDKFLENLLLVASGDGRGLGPVMDSLDKIIAVASGQEPVVMLLADNMSGLLNRFEGQSPKIDRMLDQVLGLVDSVYGKLDALNSLIEKAIPGLNAAMPMLDRLAGVYYDNFPGMERLYNTLLGPDMVTFIRQVLAAVPTAAQTMNSLILEPEAGDKWSCLSGLPIPVTVVMGIERMESCK
ncbi:MlaD family protein [Nocardia inohanensis]|uniref:MlaD family protein n=1 Tax=Nocardia inohanensis TaxID=209246 RepID=UPI00082E41C0|nr:MlaD family protein [Nocardia inohanensis]